MSARIVFTILGMTLIVGCRPSLDSEEYGELQTKVPYVPGAERPYPLPRLDKAPEEAANPAE